MRTPRRRLTGDLDAERDVRGAQRSGIGSGDEERHPARNLQRVQLVDQS